MNYLSKLRQRLRRLPISFRIAIGNAFIIILGAVGGTLITRHLASHAADLSLILLFAGLGITLTVITNYWIIKTGLRPLYELRQLVDRVQAGQGNMDDPFLQETDPDINQLAAALHSLVQQLADRTLKLRALSERAINVQEEERKRIARGLHDETAQALSMLIINLERLEQSIPLESNSLKPRLETTRQLATRALKDLRKIIVGLRPTILDDLGLVAAIRWYSRSNLEQQGVRVEFDVPDVPICLPSRLETTLFRIAQEAINNVIAHARTESALITLRQEKERVCLWISDNGRGFDVTQTSDSAVELRRLGLLGIQERADLVGGEVNVDSTPGHGTRLRVCVPILNIGEVDELDPDPAG